jgi:hypothetical protein
VGRFDSVWVLRGVIQNIPILLEDMRVLGREEKKARHGVNPVPNICLRDPRKCLFIHSFEGISGRLFVGRKEHQFYQTGGHDKPQDRLVDRSLGFTPSSCICMQQTATSDLTEHRFLSFTQKRKLDDQQALRRVCEDHCRWEFWRWQNISSRSIFPKCLQRTPSSDNGSRVF